MVDAGGICFCLDSKIVISTHGWSLGLVEVDLNGASSVAEIQRRVKAYAASHPKEPWITGMG